MRRLVLRLRIRPNRHSAVSSRVSRPVRRVIPSGATLDRSAGARAIDSIGQGAHSLRTKHRAQGSPGWPGRKNAPRRFESEKHVDGPTQKSDLVAANIKPEHRDIAFAAPKDREGRNARPECWHHSRRVIGDRVLPVLRTNLRLRISVTFCLPGLKLSEQRVVLGFRL
jgi:hypothetical protein